MAYAQSEDELDQHLADEMLFLTDACASYDAGRAAYSKIIAASVRKLVHQTSASDALLAQLGVLSEWHWRDTAEELIETNLMFTFGLVSATISWAEGDSEPVTIYNPVLDSYPRQMIPRANAFSRSPIFRERGTPMPFRFWWLRPVIRDLQRNDFSRRDIILNVANKDGGSHIDSTLGAPFAALTRQGSIALPSRSLEGEVALSKESPVPATVRQIGFEVLQTLAHYRPDLAPPA